MNYLLNNIRKGAILFLLLILISCRAEKEKEVEAAFAKVKATDTYFYSEETEESAVIYEVNIRQYSQEGTFQAFTKDIPILKHLGVQVLWVMPIFPISQTKRKGSLGSYYAVSDFTTVNPEFGTVKDVDAMITQAHAHDIAVILDWVPNHTGWDHTWITEHPEWFTQNAMGEIIDPQDPETGESYGWEDVADLNYMSRAMREQMIADLQYWVRVHKVDGFRMDVAHKVPVDFFKTAIDSLEKIKKPLFMLAEAEQADLMDNGFDMHYAWEMHHLLNEMAREEKSVQDFWSLLGRYDQTLGREAINMYFITNHDENSWAGTLGERMPTNKNLFTALTYMLPGMPLIYSGQEYDLDKRLAFFEKDHIPKEKGAYFEFLKRLGHLKNTSKALHGGKNKAALIKVDVDNPSIMAFAREKEGEQLLFIGNFSSEDQQLEMPYVSEMTDALTGKLTGNQRKGYLKPWQFKIMQPITKIDFETRIVPGLHD